MMVDPAPQGELTARRSALLAGVAMVAAAGAGGGLRLAAQGDRRRDGPPYLLSEVVPRTFGRWSELPNTAVQVVNPQTQELLDKLYSQRFDGLHCRVLETPAARRAIKKGLDLPAAFFTSQDIARQLRLPYAKLFVGVMASGWKNAKQLAFMANAFKAIRIATENGDNERGVLTVGQVTGLVRDIPTVAELMERIVAEAAAVRQRLGQAI